MPNVASKEKQILVVLSFLPPTAKPMGKCGERRPQHGCARNCAYPDPGYSRLLIRASSETHAAPRRFTSRPSCENGRLRRGCSARDGTAYETGKEVKPWHHRAKLKTYQRAPARNLICPPNKSWDPLGLGPGRLPTGRPPPPPPPTPPKKKMEKTQKKFTGGGGAR